MHPKQPLFHVNVVILVGVCGPVGISGSLRIKKKLFTSKAPYSHICIHSTFTEPLLCARCSGDTDMNKTVPVT